MTPGRKIAIVGAGTVGTTIAYVALLRGLARQVALYDLDRDRVEAEALDLSHGLQFVPPATVEGRADITVCAGADVVVITAGARQLPGQSRRELASVNAGIFRSLVPALVRVAPQAVLLVVTNPVDVLTSVALALSGLPPSRVLGSGTVLDSSRFRFLLARHCGVAVPNIHAYIAGEHGDSEVPMWSSATIGGVPALAWSVPGRPPLGPAERAAIVEQVRGAAQQIIRGKGATNYAIGLAVGRILEALLRDEGRVLPVCARLDERWGVPGVCLSLPNVVNASGVEMTLPVPMDAGEEASLRAGAQTIGEIVRACKAMASGSGSS